LELLLPEGFFKSKTAKIEKENMNPAARESTCASFDMKVLEEKLSDNKIYVNAEMLLKETHPLRLRQIEDKELYDAVRANILRLVSSQGNACDYSVVGSELEYLKERRTAEMLQKIHEIVNDEFQQGNIKSKKAIFTVGMYHLHEIIRYFDANRIIIHVPNGSKGTKDYNTELNLQKENFGISIIIPRTLADDQKILEINKLDGIVKQYRAQNSHLSSLTLPQHR
jgi:hypothetical protein